MIKIYSPKYSSINSIKKQAKDLNGHACKTDIQISNKHTKRYSLDIKEKQIKTTMTCYFISTMMAIIRQVLSIKRGNELSCIAGGNIKLCTW